MLGAVGLWPSSALAKDTIYHVKFEQDLYQFRLKSKAIKTMPGKFVVEVSLNAGSSSAIKKNPYTQAILQEAVGPHLLAAREWINAELEAFDQAVIEAQQAGVLSPEELEGRVQALNKVYEAVIAQLTLETELRAREVWQKDLADNEELRNWKITVVSRIATNTILLVRAAVSAAGSSGVSLGVEVVAIVSHASKIAKGLKDAVVTEQKARKDLQSAIRQMQGKLGGDLSKAQTFRDVMKGSERSLRTKLELYRKKWIATRQKTEGQAMSLDDVLRVAEQLQGVEGGAQAREDVVAMHIHLLAAIDEANDDRQKGWDMMLLGYELLFIAEQTKTALKAGRHTERGRLALEAFVKAYDATILVLDAQDTLIDVAIEKGIKAGTEGLKKMKSLKLTK